MSEFVIEPVQDAGEWDAIVAQSLQGSVFNSSSFIKCLGFSHTLYKIIKDSKIWGAFPIILEKEGVPLTLPWYFATYQGLMFTPEVTGGIAHSRYSRESQVVKAMLGWMQERYKRISFSLHPALADIREFSWFHYHEPKSNLFAIDIRYTGLIDLPADFDSYLRCVRELRRRQYNKAVKAGFTNRVGTPTDLPLLKKLYVATFDRQGVEIPAVQMEYFEKITSAAVKEGWGNLTFALTKDGQAVSATLFLNDASANYYLIGATDPDFNCTGAHTYLILENMREFISKNQNRVDMIGLNSPSRGDFKIGFNATPHVYYNVTWESPDLIVS